MTRPESKTTLDNPVVAAFLVTNEEYHYIVQADGTLWVREPRDSRWTQACDPLPRRALQRSQTASKKATEQ